MPIIPDAALAVVKLLLTFACILFLLRRKTQLWITIAGGCLALALLTGLGPVTLGRVLLKTLFSGEFLIMEAMMFGITLLSGLQVASGQSRRLVEGLERYLRWPRVRLMIFPALIGLLPMPGGALFSCPMLEAAARGMDISAQRKALINYWFRHIWELAWPLYPGYILVSSLLGLPLLGMMKYTAPLVLFAFLTGWFFFILDIRVPDLPADRTPEAGASPGAVLYEALPIIITIGAAWIFSLLAERLTPELPSQAAFIVSITLAVSAALLQGRGHPRRRSLPQIALDKKGLLLLLLIFFIFLFKNIINASGIVPEISRLSETRGLVYALFILLPLCCGLLTGLMVGYVGACFPILIGLAAEAGMREQILSLAVLAMISGNIGQLLTPVHVCLAVTCEYFKVNFNAVAPKLLPALGAQMSYGAGWALLLYLAGARF
jgi:integral membrane protein (TIGR00529 family)